MALANFWRFLSKNIFFTLVKKILAQKITGSYNFARVAPSLNQDTLHTSYNTLVLPYLIALLCGEIKIISLCQRLGLTRSVRNKPRVRSAGIERRRRESPPEAKDERSESFAGGARGFAKQNRVFEHIHIPLCRPGMSIQRNHYQKMN